MANPDNAKAVATCKDCGKDAKGYLYLWDYDGGEEVWLDAECYNARRALRNAK